MPWEFRGDIPIYTQLTDQLRRRIVSGDLSPGERLPSVRELSAQAGVNPNTVQRAMAEMERLGLVRSQRTAGRFVTEDEKVIRSLRTELAREQIDTFLEGMRQLGFDRAEIAALLEETAARLTAAAPERPEGLAALDRLVPIRAACEFNISAGHLAGWIASAL